MHDLPHDPAPPEPRRVLPPGEMLARGLALLGLAAALLFAAWSLAQRSILLAPLGLLAAGGAGLAAWGAAIELTGGEKFDDHPWV